MSRRLLTSDVLREIRAMLEVEIVSQPVTGTIEIARSGVVLAFAALADVASEVEVLEESAATADRLSRELKIAQAEIERLQLALIARDFTDLPLPDGRGAPIVAIDWGRRCGKGAVERGTKIIDITEVLRREQRDAGRPIGPEGGAA